MGLRTGAARLALVALHRAGLIRALPARQPRLPRLPRAAPTSEALPGWYRRQVLEPLDRGQLVVATPGTRRGWPCVLVQGFSLAGRCNSARHPATAVREAFTVAAICAAARDAEDAGVELPSGSAS